MNNNSLFSVNVNRRFYFDSVFDLERIYIVSAPSETSAIDEIFNHLLITYDFDSIDLDAFPNGLSTIGRIGTNSELLEAFQAMQVSNKFELNELHKYDPNINLAFLEAHKNILDFNDLPFENGEICYGHDICNTGYLGLAKHITIDELKVLHKHVEIYPVGDTAMKEFQNLAAQTT